MFKKPEQIKPLPPGMTDAFSKTLTRQGFVAPVQQPAPQPKPLAEGKMSEIDDALRSMSDKDFKIHYKMTKAEMRLRLKGESVSEAHEGGTCECDDSEYNSKGMCKTCGKPEDEEDMSESSHDHESMARSIEQYISKHYNGKSGLDTKDFMKAAGMVRKGDMTGARKLASTLDTDPRDKLLGMLKHDMAEALDPVDPKTVHKPLLARKDRDIDNNGKVDDSDSYIHKRRQAIARSLAIHSESLHPDAHKVLKHIKPEHQAKYKPDLTKKHYTGNYQDRSAVLKAAQSAGHLNEDAELEEGWEDMMKASRERNKPQPNGGAGKKQGTAYGGSKQKDAPPPKKEAVGEELSPAQKAIDKNKNGKVDGFDLAHLRGKKKTQDGKLAEEVKVEDKETSRIDQLVRMGLADKKTLSIIKPAVVKLKNGDTLNNNERKATNDLLTTLLDMVTSSDALFRMTKGELQKEEVELAEEVKVGDKVSFDHPMSAIPGKTMKKIGTVKRIEGDTAHLKSSTKYGTLSYQKKVSELRKEEVELTEASDYETHHNDYGSALQAVKKYAEKHGFEVDMDDWIDKTSRKASRRTGKTIPWNDPESKPGFFVKLMKDNKPAKNKIKFQINSKVKPGGDASQSRDRTYEVSNMHVEEVVSESWVVHNGSKVARFKTLSGAKAYAQKNGGEVASSEFYHDKVKKEDVALDEAPSYKLYHTTFSAAVQEAIAVAKKQGFEVDEEDYQNKVATGPKKPSKDKTNSYSVDLTKNGSPTKKKLQIQVYNMGEKYELNTYVQ